MQYRVRFTAQLRKLAEKRECLFELEQGASLEHFFHTIADSCNDAFRDALIDEKKNVRESILLFIDGVLVPKAGNLDWPPTAEIELTTMISGG